MTTPMKKSHKRRAKRQAPNHPVAGAIQPAKAPVSAHAMEMVIRARAVLRASRRQFA